MTAAQPDADPRPADEPRPQPKAKSKPKVKHPNDDLFKATTMSFGDHLEELRVCLTRALIGLVVGFLVGLWIASYVVQFIQSPLKSALEDYYIDSAVEAMTREYSIEMDEHEFKSIVSFMRTQRVTPQQIHFEASELTRLREKLMPSQPAQVGTPAESTTEPQTEAAAKEPVNSAEPPSTAEKSPRETSTAEKHAAEASPAAAKKERLPPPSADLVLTRIWRPITAEIKALNAQEAFMIWMKAGFITGVLFASPWIFYQIWVFIAAGLYPHEKNYIYIYLPFSLLLFLAGVSLAFFFVFKPVLDFLFSFNRTMHIDPDPRISEWISFVLLLPLGFGISFQLPLVMLFIERLGIVPFKAYVEHWRMSILGIFVISMVLTPADPISMLLMACPLTVLYFLGIGMCLWMPKLKSPFAEVLD